MIERTRAQGLVVGVGSALRMDYVPNTADVKQGDLVVTSSIDAIYPKGFVIGTVEAVERGSGTYLEITVRPSVDFTRLEEVLVVTTPPPAVTAEQIAKEAEAIAAAQRQQASQPLSQNASPAAPSAVNGSPRQPAGNGSPPPSSQNASPQGPSA
jgi:rod shape-determining protein MreC